MRFILLLCLPLALSTATGCMVLDEMDSAAAKMPAPKKKAAAIAETQSAKSTASTDRNALVERSRQWWDRATSLAPTALEASIIRCRLPSGTQFMSKDDCLSRGGTPTRV